VIECCYTSLDRNIFHSHLPQFCAGSSVGIVTGYGRDGPGNKSRWGRGFPHLSRPALGPTQPPVQWVPGLHRGLKSGWGVRITPHPLLTSRSRRSTAITLLPLWAVRPVQNLSACTTVHFTFTYTSTPMDVRPLQSLTACTTVHFTFLPHMQLQDPLQSAGPSVYLTILK